MNGPKNASAVWITQYLLTCRTDPAGLTPQPTAIPSGDWFDEGVTVTLVAQVVEGYTFIHWLVDAIAYDASAMSIELTMDVAHVAASCYQVTTTALETTTTATTEPPPQPLEGLMTMVLLVGTGIAAVITVVLLMIRKRKG